MEFEIKATIISFLYPVLHCIYHTSFEEFFAIALSLCFYVLRKSLEVFIPRITKAKYMYLMSDRSGFLSARSTCGRNCLAFPGAKPLPVDEVTMIQIPD